MGDYSNFSVIARGITDPRVVKEVKELADNYAGDCYYEVIIDETSVELGANDVALGSVESMAEDLHTLISEGFEVEDDEGEVTRVAVEDFQFWVNDEPKYEWMGTVYIHVPGVGDFSGSCDSDGTPVVNAGTIADLVQNASNLDLLKAEVEKLTGGSVLRAWHDYSNTAALAHQSPVSG